MNKIEDKKLKTKILSYFLVFTAISLISPSAINPLGNYLKNPNTDFLDYPIPLQQAYAETVVGTITRGDTWQKEITAYNGTNTTTKFTGGMPPYILASNGTYVDHVITTNATHIDVKSAKATFSFVKSDCTFVFYPQDKGLGSTILYTQHTTMAYKPSGQSWTVFDALTLPCTWATNTNATGKYLTVTREHTKGTLEMTYGKLKDGEFKSSSEFTNAQSPTGFQNTKVSFVEKLSGISADKFLVDKIDKFNQLQVGTQVLWTQSNMTQKVFYFLKGTNTLSIDLGTDYSDLLAVRATKTADNKIDLEIAFGQTSTNLAYGQIVRNDPTFGFSLTSADGTIAGNSGTTCTDATSAAETADTNALIQVPSTTQGCSLGYFKWDVSSVPDNISSVTNATVEYDVTSNTNHPPLTRNCTWVIPTTDTLGTTMFDDIMDNVGTVAISDSTTCVGVADGKSTLFTLAGNTAIKTEITGGDDTLTLGVRWESMARDTNEDTTQFRVDDAKLTFVYVLATPLKIRLLENDGSTAVTSASIIQANATRPTASQTATCTTNSTGWCNVGFTGLTGNQNITAKTPTNYVVNKTINTSTSDNFSITGRIYDVTGCDTTISNLMMNDTDKHRIASVPLTPSCSIDVLTFNYFYKNLGHGSYGSNKTTTLRFEVPQNSVYARDQVALVNGSSITLTYADGVLTSGAIQVGTGAIDVILKVTINLRGDHRIVSYENDKSTKITSGSIIYKNSSATQTLSINSTGFVLLTGVTGSGNITQKESVDNFVTNKTYGLQLVGNIGVIGLIFDGSCPQNGAGNDFQFKINATNFHRISTHTTPTCVTTGNNFNVTADITFTADGNASSLTNQTSIIDIDITNATALGKNLIRLRANGTAIDTTYSSGEITSSAIQIAHGMKTIILSINFALDPKPDQVSGLTIDCTTSTTCNLSWTAPNAGIDGIDGYKITRNGAVIVTDTGSTSVSYTDTGLSVSSSYSYQVSAINQYGTGIASSSASDSTGSGSDPIGGGSPGGGGGAITIPIIPTTDGIKTLTLKQQTHTLGFGISRTFPLELVWNTPENIKITKIIPDTASLGDIQIIPQEQPIILPGTEGATTENPSKGEIQYTIIIPQEECRPPAIAINCAERRLYIIPLEISAVFEDRTVTSSSQIRIDLTGGLDYGLITIMAVGSVVTLSVIRYGRKSKGKASKRGYEKAIARNHHK